MPYDHGKVLWACRSLGPAQAFNFLSPETPCIFNTQKTFIKSSIRTGMYLICLDISYAVQRFFRKHSFLRFLQNAGHKVNECVSVSQRGMVGSPFPISFGSVFSLNIGDNLEQTGIMVDLAQVRSICTY